MDQVDRFGRISRRKRQHARTSTAPRMAICRTVKPWRWASRPRGVPGWQASRTRKPRLAKTGFAEDADFLSPQPGEASVCKIVSMSIVDLIGARRHAGESPTREEIESFQLDPSASMITGLPSSQP